MKELKRKGKKGKEQTEIQKIQGTYQKRSKNGEGGGGNHMEEEHTGPHGGRHINKWIEGCAKTSKHKRSRRHTYKEKESTLKIRILLI